MALKYQRAQGFTLLEVLVVLALTSVIMLALTSAMRSTAQTEDRIDQRLQRGDELRVVTNFLRSTLGRISAEKKPGMLAVNEPQYFFAGAATDLAWLGVMPARHGAGGRHFFKLSLGRSGQEPALMVRFAPWAEASSPPNWSMAEAYPLVQGVVDMQLAYADMVLAPGQWVPTWTLPDKLPTHIRLNLQTQAGEWPPIVVPLRVMPGSDPSASGATFGGSR